MSAVTAKTTARRQKGVSVLASDEEWASLFISLSKYFGGLDARDFANRAHCQRAFALLQRAAEVA